MGCSYQEAVEALYSLASQMPPRQYLGGMGGLLGRLGEPQNDFESIIVAGTNGKGSVTAMAASALERARLKTGRYLSPHIDDLRERICIDGKMISKRKFASLYSEIWGESRRCEPVTFFEFLTALALLHFSDERADCSVLEVGLGGRLDATNLARSRLGAITEIGLEHTDVLGKTLSRIAWEKAGIIREGGALVTAEGKKEPLGEIEKTCRKKNAKLVRVGQEIALETVECTDSKNVYEVRGLEGTYALSLSMLGAHQGRNAAVAVGLCEGMGVGTRAIEEGISNTKLPCRLEVIGRKPLMAMDCAHNPHAARELAKSLRLFDYEKLILVSGMMKDKDHEGFFREMGANADWIIVNEPSYGRAAKLSHLFGIAGGFCDRVIGVKDVRASVELAKSIAGPKDLICIAGSIYMLSEARGHGAGVTQ